MIDVLSPINSAYERTQKILFPFNMERWVPIAFAAFLMYPSYPLGANGTSSNSNHDISGLSAVVLVVCAIVAAIALAFSVFLMWLNARGKFMFLDNLLVAKPSISEPWVKYGAQANLLFLFNLGIVGVFIAFSILAIIPFVIFSYMGSFGTLLDFIFGVVLCLILLPIVAIMLSFGYFGTAIMYKQGISPWAAFQITTGFLLRDPVGMIGFFFAMFGLQLTFALALLLAIVATLCSLACLIAIPFVGSLVLLPVTVFFQCYTLDVLAQFGPEYDVFSTGYR